MDLAVQSNATTRCWGLSLYFRSRSNAVSPGSPRRGLCAVGWSGDASPAECSWSFTTGCQGGTCYAPECQGECGCENQGDHRAHRLFSSNFGCDVPGRFAPITDSLNLKFRIRNSEF